MNKQEIEKAIDDLDDLKNCESISSGHFKEVHGKNLELAISALTQQLNNGWIPVFERLPKKTEFDWVLVQISETDLPHVAEHRDDGWHKDDESYSRFEDWTEVIAWQPLPERYKEKLNEE